MTDLGRSPDDGPPDSEQSSGQPSEGEHGRFDLPGLVRRLRRRADMSQRQMALAADLPRTRLVRAETGVADLPVADLVRLARLSGARLVLLGEDGQEITPMSADGVRNAAGRRFPAHLDTRHGDEQWWGGSHRPGLRPPRYTYDLDRRARDDRRHDDRRHDDPTVDDHHRPEVGDSLADRAAARRAERAAAAAREHRRHFLAGELPPSPPDPTCSCPPACDELLETELRAPHVDACRCRCDLG